MARVGHAGHAGRPASRGGWRVWRVSTPDRLSPAWRGWPASDACDIRGPSAFDWLRRRTTRIRNACCVSLCTADYAQRSIQGSGAAVPRSSGAVRSCAELRSRNRLWVGWDDLALSGCISAPIKSATRVGSSLSPAFCVGEVSRLCDGSLQCLVRVPPRRKGSSRPIMGWRWAPTRPSPPWDCDISTTPRHASHARRGRASLATRQARRAGGRG